jgi:hypothetical protein
MSRTRMDTYATGCLSALLAAATVLAAAACGGPGAAAPGVPSLTASAPGTQAKASAAARAGALHAAAQCVRQHGIPDYADPVLTPGGQVYSDSRGFADASPSVIDAVKQACETLMARADLNPMNEPSAPPQLVRAGVRSAECLRAHGLPRVTDPSAQSPYTPGHGFGFTGSEMPSGGKQDPAWQRAAQACRAVLDAEIQASTLSSLSNDG